MSEQPYTPTVRQLRSIYIEAQMRWRPLDMDDHLRAKRRREVADEFDRWLAGVKADAWDEAVDAAGNHIFSGHPGDLPNPYRQEATR